ncbi:hypothetical protein, partial [Nonomuraea cypriaca]|uniref:hypothetical protein n=1 Tax=Nonomuraea cypriaca TaxID=1187855 RepID=UPI001A9C4CA5
ADWDRRPPTARFAAFVIPTCTEPQRGKLYDVEQLLRDPLNLRDITVVRHMTLTCGRTVGRTPHTFMTRPATERVMNNSD